MKGGRAPLSHFPPGHAGVKLSGFDATVFRTGEYPQEGNPDLWSASLREAQRDGGSLFSFTTRRSGNVDLRSAPLREAQRDGGSLFSFTTRRSGNADLRSAPLRVAPRAADRSSLSRHAGTGTPTSGRHRCAKRSERRIAPLFHDTPVRERRPPVGTAARRAASGAQPNSFTERGPEKAEFSRRHCLPQEGEMRNADQRDRANPDRRGVYNPK